MLRCIGASAGHASADVGHGLFDSHAECNQDLGVKDGLAQVERKQLAGLPGFVSIQRFEGGRADSRYLSGVGEPDLLDLCILAGAVTGREDDQRKEDCDEA
jgi:hypothetical protein